MIKFENTEVLGWEHAIRGMRNPMNSWEKSDSGYRHYSNLTHTDMGLVNYQQSIDDEFELGPNDRDLMMRLRNAGTDHRKFMRMIAVYVDLTAPLYWWKEFDTYKIGTVANSCSTMHKIAAKEFTLEDFSCEHLYPSMLEGADDGYYDNIAEEFLASEDVLKIVVNALNAYRNEYIFASDDLKSAKDIKDITSLKAIQKKAWWQMIQLLPSSYNQRRTVQMNYEVLANIYKSRRNHKLDEWRELCEWIEGLPYSELIVGERSDGTGSESKRFVEISQVFQKSFQEGLEEGLNENKDLVFKIPKDHISPEALELLEKGFAIDMSIGFKEWEINEK